MEPLKQHCIEALKRFVADASNENKLDLHLAYEDINEEEREQVLGAELHQILLRILRDNDHPDAFLKAIQL